MDDKMAKTHKMTPKEYEALTARLIELWIEYQDLREKWKYAEVVEDEE